MSWIYIIVAASKELNVSATSLLKDPSETDRHNITGDMVQQCAERIVSKYVDLTMPAMGDEANIRY